MLHPRMRLVEIFPVGGPDDATFAFRDPEGFSPTIVAPWGAALLASLMNGQRTLADIQIAFQQQVGAPAALADLERLVAQLDETWFLDSPRFQARYESEINAYLASSIRPAAHAGGAYESEPEKLREQLNALFAKATTNGASPLSATNGFASPPASHGKKLRGVLSPHIDLHRGGHVFAHAYRRILEESDADLFIVFGTAHGPTQNLFALTRKNYDTPLGIVQTDQMFLDALARELGNREQGIGNSANGLSSSPVLPSAFCLLPFSDDLPHRKEHSIEFQMLFLQHILGERRPFTAVPILTGSFHPHVESGESPESSAEIARFVAALRAAEQELSAPPHSRKICYISGGDLAHVGRRFGDEWLLDDDRLLRLSENDHQLLAGAARANPLDFFQHIAKQKDSSRICGLAPTWTMLEAMRPASGELLAYDQAVDPDRTSCVSFASMAFYG